MVFIMPTHAEMLAEVLQLASGLPVAQLEGLLNELRTWELAMRPGPLAFEEDVLVRLRSGCWVRARSVENGQERLLLADGTPWVWERSAKGEGT